MFDEVREARKAKAILIKMANEDPYRVLEMMAKMPKEDKENLRYIKRIAEREIARSAKNRAEGLFAR